MSGKYILPLPPDLSPNSFRSQSSQSPLIPTYTTPHSQETTETGVIVTGIFFFFFGTIKRSTIKVDPVSVPSSSRRSWLGRRGIQRVPPAPFLQSIHLPLFLAQAPGPSPQTSHLAQSLVWGLPSQPPYNVPQPPKSLAHTDTRTQALYRPQNKNDEIVLFPGVQPGDWSGKGKRGVGGTNSPITFPTLAPFCPPAPCPGRPPANDIWFPFFNIKVL